MNVFCCWCHTKIRETEDKTEAKGICDNCLCFFFPPYNYDKVKDLLEQRILSQTQRAMQQVPTKEEVRVLQALAQGYYYDEDIARQMGTTPEIVHQHLHTVCQRLFVSSRLQALTKAYRKGYVDLSRME